MAIKYSKDHEWINMEGEIAVVGISDYAQEQLGEIVFIELPEAGKQLDKGDEACVIESVKAASEIYAPASGDVTEGNGDLDAAPGKVNEDATGEGWLFKMTLNDPTELNDMMDAGAYKEYVEGLG
ncbi:MAG: glycine cleavage system protein GcvH [Rhodospirillales bacterium]|jgi:glycine cleavage system H protein|nr:glycine cleavage system protein GcvH [Rhodospirillales bacterium]HJO74526.1 glycine cleavage system protein GcvH [Rhodospirillales bacterium]